MSVKKKLKSVMKKKKELKEEAPVEEEKVVEEEPVPVVKVEAKPIVADKKPRHRKDRRRRARRG